MLGEGFSSAFLTGLSLMSHWTAPVSSNANQFANQMILYAGPQLQLEKKRAWKLTTLCQTPYKAISCPLDFQQKKSNTHMHLQLWLENEQRVRCSGETAPNCLLCSSRAATHAVTPSRFWSASTQHKPWDRAVCGSWQPQGHTGLWHFLTSTIFHQ